jgi:hypothetical protein
MKKTNVVSKKKVNQGVASIVDPVVEVQQIVDEGFKTIGDLGVFNMNRGFLKSDAFNIKVKPDLILKSCEGGVLDARKINYTGKQILNTVMSKFKPLSSSECFVYPDAVSFPGMVIEKRFDDEVKADLGTLLSSTVFNRFIARIDIATMAEGTLSFCMKFDQYAKVLEASIGYNHRICSNFTIFSKDNIKKLGREFDYNDFREFINSLVSGSSYLIDQFGKRIEDLDSKKFDKVKYYELLGKAYTHAAKYEHSLQYTSLNEVARKNVGTEINTGWDILNAFTLGTRIDTGRGLDNLQQLANTCEFVLENLK